MSASGRRGVASRRGWLCQGVHGVWQQAQVTGDVRHIRVGRFLKLVSHCSIHLDEENRMIALVDGPHPPNPLVISENILNENCSPSYSLQFLLKDQDLIPKES